MKRLLISSMLAAIVTGCGVAKTPSYLGRTGVDRVSPQAQPHINVGTGGTGAGPTGTAGSEPGETGPTAPHRRQ